MNNHKIIININKEFIPLSEVPAIVAQVFGGEPVSRQAVYQWVSEGRIAADGSRVKLETVMRSRRKHTTRKWIKTFVEAL